MDTMIRNDITAPDFTLKDLNDQPHSLSDYHGHLVAINFWSARCPWTEQTDKQLLADLKSWGDSVTLLPIASNADEPSDLLSRVAEERGISLVLRDENHRIADLYHVQVTPHLFLVDKDGILRYQGSLDDRTFRRRKASRHYFHQAVEALLAGRSPSTPQTSAYGCALVRYKP
jgi:peroxiredoxin